MKPSPISPEALQAGLVERVLALGTPALVLVDGAPPAGPGALAQSLADALRAHGRATLHVDSHQYWRDASVRLEYGREDVDSYLDWVDGPALHREVVAPLRDGQPVLPSLRDPVSNRSTRAAPVPADLVIISGELLLQHDLDPDLIIHLALSPAGLARRMRPEQEWTLPAFERYDAVHRPISRGDVVVRCDDARHPAVIGLR